MTTSIYLRPRLVPVLVLACLVLSIQGVFADQVDDIVHHELTVQHVPGAWVVVMRHGKLLKRKGYGIANLEYNVPVKPETLMQTGSIGKMFTAAGIMVLAGEGKLKLTDALASYFDHSPDWWKPITIRNLLSHTGGIPDYEGREYRVDFKKNYTEDELVEFAQKMKPDFAPGEKWSYSNTDYVLLGIIIHKVTGKPYADFLKERVWTPAGMPAARLINDIEVIPDRSGGYDWDNNRWQNQDWVSPALNSTADGAMYVTADDMIQWDHALDQNTLLPKATQEEMWTPARLNDGTAVNYGFGWTVGSRLGRPWVGHGGSWQGFRSFYIRYREEGLSIAVFCNCSSADPRKVARNVAGVYVRDLSVERHAAIVDTDHTLPDIRRILAALFAGKQPLGKLGGELAAMPQTALASLKQEGAKFGPLVSIELIYRRIDAKSTFYTYRVRFRHWMQEMSLTRDEQGNYFEGKNEL